MNEVTDGAPNLPPVPPKRRRAPRKKTITIPASESFMAAEPPQTSLNVDYPLQADEESASSPEPNQQCSCPQGPLRWIFLALAAVVLFAVVMLINDRIKTLPPVNPNGQNGNGQGNDSLTEKLAGQSKIMKFENYDDLKEFLENTKVILNNSAVNFIDKGRRVSKIAIVPGGGTDPRLIQGAIYRGCDTYLTGEYYNKLKIPHGDEERKKFNKLVGGLNINMVEGSHYSTERLVFVNELPKLFNNLGLSYQFIEQDDPWY